MENQGPGEFRMTRESYLENITTIFVSLEDTIVHSDAVAFEEDAKLINAIIYCDVGLDHTANLKGPMLRQRYAGMNFPEMVTHMACWKGQDEENLEGDPHGFEPNLRFCDITRERLDDYNRFEHHIVTNMVSNKLVSCSGAVKQLEQLKSDCKYQVVVVSSSTELRALTWLMGMDINKYQFKLFCSADDATTSTAEWKTNSKIFEEALKSLGKAPEECIVVTSSWRVAGAAHKAKMRVIGYTGAFKGMPDPEGERKKLVDTSSLWIQDGWRVMEMRDWAEFQGCLHDLAVDIEINRIFGAHEALDSRRRDQGIAVSYIRDG